jgi:hypothetical protein
MSSGWTTPIFNGDGGYWDQGVGYQITTATGSYSGYWTITHGTTNNTIIVPLKATSTIVAAVQGQLYFDTSVSPYNEWVYNGGNWIQKTSVTSVAVAVPARQSVSGSPITGSGTITISDNTQSANLVFSGPSSGSAAAPTFRSLVAADLPLATTGAFGAVKPDGTTIDVSSGVISLATPVTVANGGTGTNTPSLVAGTNVAVTGTWPNQTVAAQGTLYQIPVTFTAGTYLPGQGVGGSQTGTFALTSTCITTIYDSTANSNDEFFSVNTWITSTGAINFLVYNSWSGNITFGSDLTVTLNLRIFA